MQRIVCSDLLSITRANIGALEHQSYISSMELPWCSQPFEEQPGVCKSDDDDDDFIYPDPSP